jgi:hypothetical protein
MAQVQYRPVREEEIPAAVELFRTALADLYKRHNLNTPLPDRAYAGTCPESAGKISPAATNSPTDGNLRYIVAAERLEEEVWPASD